MTIEEMKRRKTELGYTNAQISALSGVPLGTVQKIFSGATESPRYDTLMALSRIFQETPPSPSCQTSYDGPAVTSASMVGEPACPYKTASSDSSIPPVSSIGEAASSYMGKKQGEYTLEDYYKIPDDIRVELIDGVIYDMSAPTSAHQLIAGILHAKLYNHVMQKKGPCLPMISPLDVQLDCDDKTMIQPDVIIVCDRSKVINHCIYGAPDFVVEILSPSTKHRDCIIKLNKYKNAGVREYWLIDPLKLNVIVYNFEHDNYPITYDFNSTIPVGVWDDECVIDFQEIYDYIRFLYE